MRKISLLLFLLCSFTVFGQMRMVSQKVQHMNQMKQSFTDVQLFSKNEHQKTNQYLRSATDVTVLSLNEAALQEILKDAPARITLSVPYLDKTIPVQLFKNEVMTDSFVATNESGQVIDYQPGKYYRGVVQGDYNSLVAISFFEDDIIGVISTMEDGNIVLGKSVNYGDYVTYSENNLLGTDPFECATNDLKENYDVLDQISFDPLSNHATNTDNCVRIYYEISYNVFKNRGHDLTNTLNWITGIQNNIGTLYSNDDIQTSISQIMVWTYADPYTGNYESNLFKFQSTVKDFNGDLAHFVNTPSTTSVAFLDSLCTDYKYAYSGVSMNYAEVPTYSWTIMAMAHEMGHALGSPHTHACAWNGNNTAIDGCGQQAGYGEGCTGPIPSGGGTIMSYCHLTSVGINMAAGFGAQPAQLIRNTVNSKDCLGSDCVSVPDYCTYAIKSLKSSNMNSDLMQFDIDDNNSTAWKYQIVPYKDALSEDNWVNLNQKSFTISSSTLTPHQYYEVYVTNVCADGTSGSMEKVVILAGDFCDGTLFTDTGGVDLNYSNNEYFVKKFYPSIPNGKVQLNFLKFRLQNQSDFLRVYNGDMHADNLFPNGVMTGNMNTPPSFTSTAEDGSITVEFTSDGGGVMFGWEATVSCDTLGVADFNDEGNISIYPNPAADFVQVSSKASKIDSYDLTDTSGRKVLSSKVNAFETKIDIKHLPKGVYILTLKSNGQSIHKKIVKI
ncbi:MAG TPA: T9SS type A sorting domain-containing protein [Moheibacter sp.]|nr:T9SS type A sorting domain-containing protein [Moheibacter sp.]